jgi:hypothetical protein
MYLCLTENPAHTLELNFYLHRLGILILYSVCLKKSLLYISKTGLNTRSASPAADPSGQARYESVRL